MAGSYCIFCQTRCFVLRRLPEDAGWRPGQTVHLATCKAGMDHDENGCGYTHETAITDTLGSVDPDVYRSEGYRLD